MIVIGLTGKAGSGKNTFANMAQGALESQGIRIEQVAFADKLKQMVCVLLGCSRETLEDRVFKETPHPTLGGKTPRQAMQTLGTEWGRNLIDGQIWINATRSHIASLPPSFIWGGIPSPIKLFIARPPQKRI